MKIFGIDPGSERTGYGCVESSGSRHRLIACGTLSAPARATFPQRLTMIHAGLAALLARHRPDCVAVENIFYARNVRSALKLGHARGVALLAAAEAGVAVVEYAPAEIKRAVVGYGRAEKPQVQQMMKLLLGLASLPAPDAADALAVAICHLHTSAGIRAQRPVQEKRRSAARTWRDFRAPAARATLQHAQGRPEQGRRTRREVAERERAGVPASAGRGDYGRPATAMSRRSANERGSREGGGPPERQEK